MAKQEIIDKLSYLCEDYKKRFKNEENLAEKAYFRGKIEGLEFAIFYISQLD